MIPMVQYKLPTSKKRKKRVDIVIYMMTEE